MEPLGPMYSAIYNLPSAIRVEPFRSLDRHTHYRCSAIRDQRQHAWDWYEGYTALQCVTLVTASGTPNTKIRHVVCSNSTGVHNVAGSTPAFSPGEMAKRYTHQMKI